jgi:hypothetical protein
MEDKRVNSADSTPDATKSAEQGVATKNQSNRHRSLRAIFWAVIKVTALYLAAYTIRKNRFILWIYLVIGIPFLILVLIGGWATEFRSGNASAFMCGAIVAAAAENFIERVTEWAKRVTGELKDSDEAQDEKESHAVGVTVLISYFVGLFTWNAYFAVADKSVQYPTADWVQILAFFLTVATLPLFRGFVDYY